MRLARTRRACCASSGARSPCSRRLGAALGDAELWAVVKADGYGHGAADVAPAALEAGATALCVASVAEALALRPVVPGARIVVMGPGGRGRGGRARGGR